MIIVYFLIAYFISQIMFNSYGINLGSMIGSVVVTWIVFYFIKIAGEDDQDEFND